MEPAQTLCTFLRFPIWCTRSTDEAPWFPNLLLGIPQLIIFSHLEASKQIDTTPYIYICPLRLLFELAHTLCPFWIYRYGTFETLMRVLGGVIYCSAYTQSIWFLTWKQKKKSRQFYIYIDSRPKLNKRLGRHETQTAQTASDHDYAN